MIIILLLGIIFSGVFFYERMTKIESKTINNEVNDFNSMLDKVSYKKQIMEKREWLDWFLL